MNRLRWSMHLHSRPGAGASCMHAGRRWLAAWACVLFTAGAGAQVSLIDVSSPHAGQVVARIAVDSPKPPQAASFSLRLGAAAAVSASKVDELPQDQGSAALILCLDRSGSMTAPVVATLRDAVLQTLGPSQGASRLPLQVGIIAFATRHSPLVRPTSDPKEIAAAISHLQVDGVPGGKTRLHDAMLAGIAELNNLNVRWKHLLVVSDGGDEGSLYSDRDLAKALEDNPAIVVDLIGFGPDARLAAGPVASHSGRTKGIAVFPQTQQELADELRSVIRGSIQKTRPYSVTFDYEAATDGSKAEAPTLVYRPAAGAEVPVKLQADIAATRATPGAGSAADGSDESAGLAGRLALVLGSVPWPVWIVLAAALMAGVLFLLMRRSPKPVQAPLPEVIATPAGPAPAEPTVVNPLPVVALGATVPPRVAPTQPAARRNTVVMYPWPAPGSVPVVAVLHGISGAAQNLLVELTQPSLRLGAADDNDVALSGDDFVSGHHMILKAEASSLYAVDLDSRNGSDLNGNPFKGSTRSLQPGDRLTIGHSTFVVDTAGSAPPRSHARFEPRVS